MTILTIVLKRIGSWLRSGAEALYERIRSWFVSQVLQRSDDDNRDAQD